ncbi:VRR-NUC domain-containing protein [Veronia pacifica]|uniref:VRR-NUC domain-containing protein n=1 Tax=Veronia pacifica TaxID=1080227 RepID=A0A1C3EPS4_9GAMM|nr:VRR-NUC domain-containing protein [Veronia pacifica]ODA35215.1 hypothetical protein A8L45_04695 [Veronia pacifica]
MITTTPPPVLPDFYYLSNFETLIDFVSRQYLDLLNTEEQQWLESYASLSRDGKALTVRFLSRRSDWFRRDKISYQEIDDIDKTLEELQLAGVVNITHTPPPEACCELLTKPELIVLLPDSGIQKQAKKQVFVDYMLNHKPEINLPFLCVSLKNHTIMPILLLLFFGNAHQDLSQFVLGDLGIHIFEQTDLSRDVRLFQHREHIENWLALSALSEQFWLAGVAKDKDKMRDIADNVANSELSTAFNWQPLERKRQRLMNRIGRELERQTHLGQALTFYRQSELPPSRERQARILIKQKEYSLAANIVANMLNAPKDEEEHETAGRIARQLVKKIELEAPEKVSPAFSSDTLTLDIGRSVERSVAEHFQSHGWQVWYCENLLINAVFGLAFWDIIFSPVEGAFLNPFQRSPRDMYDGSFYANREYSINCRLQDIENGGLTFIFDVYQKKYGLSNDWIVWEYVKPELLDAAIPALSPKQWVACFQRLLFDPRTNRKGHADLFMTKGDNHAFVEVKGPGDSLQHHQIRWLNYLHLHDITCSVLYVQQLPTDES